MSDKQQQELPTELLISVFLHLPARELNRLQLLSRAVKREIHAKDYIWKVFAFPNHPYLEAVHPARPRPAQPVPDRPCPRLAKRDANQDGEFHREADREAHVRAAHSGLGHQGGEGEAEQATVAEARAETPGEAAEIGRIITIADCGIS